MTDNIEEQPKQKLRFVVEPTGATAPGFRLTKKHIFLGIEEEFVQKIVDEYTGEVIQQSDYFNYFHPKRMVLRENGKYSKPLSNSPQEVARRKRQIERGYLKKENGLVFDSEL